MEQNFREVRTSILKVILAYLKISEPDIKVGSLLIYIAVIAEELSKLQKVLTEYFLECYSEIELFTWNDEEYVVRLEDVYVPLRWIRYTKEAGEEVKKELTSYHEAFHKVNMTISKLR